MAHHNDNRPDPDALLASIQKEQAKEGRGKLKIFFGMSAGVGKTYAMLTAARQLLDEGRDVVIGYIETHKRAETENLLGGLPVIPPVVSEYHGASLREPDVDAILKRVPEIVLIDELAHTNAPASRHSKRYQDVMELLDSGISVYTTLNVQHLESRADTVRQITGVTVHETVPDSVLELANDIELVDLPPEKLLQRLSEGKVYTQERSQQAVANFFRKGNLTALREMALRTTAEFVDRQMLDYMALKQIAGPWKSKERLLVAIGPSPYSEQLIRWTRRMAGTMEAAWIALYVQTSKATNAAENQAVTKNIALARELGAEVITTTDDDIVRAIVRTSRQNNVTQIVVGKPSDSPVISLLKGGSIPGRLMRASGDIDVYVSRADPSHVAQKKRFNLGRPTSSIGQYLFAAGIIIALCAVCASLRTNMNYHSVGLLFLFTVTLLCFNVGRGPILMAGALSALLWNFLFIPPLYTFSIASPEDVLIFSMYFIIALVTGHLTARIRTQEQAVMRREERAAALYRLSKQLAEAVNTDAVVKIAVRHIGSAFQSTVAVILQDDTGRLSESAHENSTFKIDLKERSVAAWAFENAKPAGQTTTTLPMAAGYYLPLNTPRGTIGVIGIRFNDATYLSIDQMALLNSYVSQIATVLEREILSQQAASAKMLTESERLYTTLLNSISHELRTPLAIITGASSGLMDPVTASNTERFGELVTEIGGASERLNRLVENLLNMTRIESGMMRLNSQWCDVADVVGTVLSGLKSELTHHKVSIHVPQDLPLVKLDFVLIERALVNIVHNAALYAPEGSEISCAAAISDNELRITINDNGPGIDEEAIPFLFDKFFRAPNTRAGGTGLGLSIARGFIQAHGGNITAANRESGGSRFTIIIPVETRSPTVPEHIDG